MQRLYTITEDGNHNADNRNCQVSFGRVFLTRLDC
jgi:hypothetical protein